MCLDCIGSIQCFKSWLLQTRHSSTWIVLIWLTYVYTIIFVHAYMYSQGTVSHVQHINVSCCLAPG
uniref:Uncharacterized protein n=1 Tax=Octopus bimaculoides TaxID=37653 RepID=A0A0L8FSS8_OCTBM